MKELFSGLFSTKNKRIVRTIEIALFIFSIAFFIYEKKTPNPLHFEEDDFSFETVNDQYAYTLSDLNLKAGVYRFSLNAISSEEGASLYVQSSKLSGIRLKTGPASLPTTSLSSYVIADLRGNTDDLQVVVTLADSGVFQIQSLDIVKTTDASKRSFATAIFVIILLELCLWLSEKEKAVRIRAFVLAAMTLISCYPLFSDYLMESHDILFHLARIEGLAEGLKAGAFPVKIQPFWGNDYGYAVGVFYGDILLYFPALMRLLGFSVQSVFQIHLAFIQLLTVLISYFSFKRMFKKADTALFGTALYLFANYRLENTYTRAAIGEFTAMAFLPLILCGFYMILADRDPRETQYSRLKACIITALGLTGLIGSHILSCEMIAFFIILVLLISIKKVFVKRNFADLLTTLVMTLILNIGFLLPLVDFYFQPLNIRSDSWQGGSSTGIQEYGLSPLQLFSVFGRSNGGSYVTTMGINKEVSFNIGIILFLLLLVFLGFIFCRTQVIKANRNYKAACIMAFIGCLSLFMSTCYFPWNSISSWGKGIAKVISTIQYPWRFVGFATIALTFVACFVFDVIKEFFSKEVFTAFVTSSLLLLFISAGWYFNNLTMESDPYRVYNSYEVCNYAFYTAEYLYEGTDFKNLEADRVYTKDAEISQYSKKGTSIEATISTSGKSYVEFPLNYYKYYSCKASDGQKFEVTPGSNNCLRVNIPSAYNGQIEVAFIEPLFWRLAELISALSFAFVLVLLWIINREK